MTSINQSVGKVQLVHPSVLSNNNTSTGSVSTSNTTSYQNDSVNVVPTNYPQVTNTIPANIFPQTNTNPTDNTTNPTGTNTNTTIDPTKPVSMEDAQWAADLEEKSKTGYKPTAAENTRYQDIVTRFQANGLEQPGVLDMLAAQSSSLGSQIGGMRFAPAVGKELTNIKNTIRPKSGVTSTGSVGQSLKTIGVNLGKASGLSALVAGGFSLVTNGIMALQGKKEWSDVAGTVSADTANGAVSGVGAALGAGALTMFGATGMAGTLLVGLGAVGGAYLGDKLFRGTGAYDWVKTKVEGLFKQDNPVVQNNVTGVNGAQTYTP